MFCNLKAQTFLRDVWYLANFSQYKKVMGDFFRKYIVSFTFHYPDTFPIPRAFLNKLVASVYVSF